MARKDYYAIGVDLGGTNIAAGIVDSTGKVLLREKIPTMVALGGNTVLSRLALVITLLFKKASPSVKNKIKGIGVGIPGMVEHEKGIVHEPPNIPALNGVNVKKFIQQRFKKPAFIANDANAHALGEHTFGAGKGTRNMVCITLGTGLGGGIILNGKLFTGSFETAGELGHIVIRKEGIPCNCGNRGCVEAYVGANFIAERARKAIKAGTKSSVTKLVNGDLSLITPHLLEKAARKGDRYALQLWTEIGKEIGTAIVSIANILGPEKVVVGGGVSRAGSILFKPMIKEFKKRSYRYLRTRVKIVPAKLRDDAGILGSSSLVFKQN